MVPYSKFPLFYPSECSLGVPLQPEDQGQTIDRFHPGDMHLAMNTRLGRHHLQEDDLQDVLSMAGQIDMISTAQDHCRARHPHDALEPVHTRFALTPAPRQGEGAHREGVQGIADVEVQVTVATAQRPVVTLIEVAAPAGTDLRGLTTDGDEFNFNLIRAHLINILLYFEYICRVGGTMIFTISTNSFSINHLVKE